MTETAPIIIAGLFGLVPILFSNITKNNSTTHPEIKDIKSLSRKDSIYGNGFLSQFIIIDIMTKFLMIQSKNYQSKFQL